ncbi:MAG: hydrophobic protein [Acidimicrobiales bacterium]
MGVILLVLLLALLLGGFGFALHFLWIIAFVVLVIWLVGFAMGGRGRASGSRGWYRW